ncbi:MAG TPA: signal recognition particle-docking protein FtsY [Solirubrobacteraceae bacterium]|jgi:fused signal recognition particle receptor|nr:signal recognition particle-docking protein FtsY [Solirubrobacteraceae bacterium]
MAREWADLLLLRSGQGEAVDEGEEEPAEEERRRGFTRRLRESLRSTREAIGGGFSRRLRDGDWEELEEALIMADVGAAASAEIVASLELAAREERLAGEDLPERLAALLADAARAGEEPAAIDLRADPTVVLMVGVNGTGKTTTLGKLAWQLRRNFGLRVLLGAADTYRAAATEQLEEWARRAGCEIVTGAAGSDPGAVAFEAVGRARGEGYDVVLIDTAGRLHNQEPLMAELEKIRRVIGRQLEDAPHETLLSIDATTGQNGLRQAELFAQAVDVDGIVLTKLDGSAKGGVAIAIARELAIPVKLVGVGEALEDLAPFDPDDFARALLDID